MLYFIVIAVILTLMDKSSQIHCTSQQNARICGVRSNSRIFGNSHDGRKKITAVVMFWISKSF